MLQRLALAQLASWKRRAARKPVLIDGARQVGKSWLVGKLFGPREFRKVHWLDFRAEPRLANLFVGSLDSAKIVGNIEVALNERVDIERDLLFFDEVAECQRAVDSLKYFAERMPGAFVCASGSNIGLLRSFPVGQVEQMELFPLCFEEFVMAAGRPPLLDAFRSQRRNATTHAALWSLLQDYYFVGGMPEAVAAWFSQEQSALARAERVTAIQRDLVSGYRRDFGKYAGHQDAQHIERVFDDVPAQLALNHDGSVARYRFKGVLPHRQRYQQLAGPIDWLQAARLVWKCFPVEGRPETPLRAHAKANRFRLFFFDVGLLGHMLGLTHAEGALSGGARGASPSQERALSGGDQGASYKGFVAENFVQTELCARIGHPTYGWYAGRAEVEFLHRCRNGEVVPVEVKSGSRTQARSLRSYIDRYAPSRAIKLIGGLGGHRAGAQPGGLETWPLYDAQFLKEL